MLEFVLFVSLAIVHLKAWDNFGGKTDYAYQPLFTPTRVIMISARIARLDAGYFPEFVCTFRTILLFTGLPLSTKD